MLRGLRIIPVDGHVHQRVQKSNNGFKSPIFFQNREFKGILWMDFVQHREFQTLQSTLGGVPREQKMLKGHLPRVVYPQVYEEKVSPANS